MSCPYRNIRLLDREAGLSPSSQYVAARDVEWPGDQPTAQGMPDSIPGYEPTGETGRSDFRVLGDGTAS